MAQPSQTMTRIFRHSSLAYVVVALGAALSLVAWYVTAQLVDRQVQVDVETRAQAAVGAIERRAQEYLNLLRGLERLFGHDLIVSRGEFN